MISHSIRAVTLASNAVEIFVWLADHENRASEMTTFVPAAWARSISSSTRVPVQLRQRLSWIIEPLPPATRLKKAIVEVAPRSRRASASSTCEVVTKAMTSPRSPLAANPNFAGS